MCRFPSSSILTENSFVIFVLLCSTLSVLYRSSTLAVNRSGNLHLSILSDFRQLSFFDTVRYREASPQAGIVDFVVPR